MKKSVPGDNLPGGPSFPGHNSNNGSHFLSFSLVPVLSTVLGLFHFISTLMLKVKYNYRLYLQMKKLWPREFK